MDPASWQTEVDHHIAGEKKPRLKKGAMEENQTNSHSLQLGKKSLLNSLLEKKNNNSLS